MQTEIILRYLNSMHYREFHPSEDRLQDDGWREKFIQKFSLRCEANDSGVLELTQLRNAGRNILRAYVGGNEPSEEDVACLNSFIPKKRMALQWHGTSVDRSFVLDNVERMSLVEILATAIAEHLSGPEAKKLKFCTNPKCHWAYFDRSRNQSRRWCSSAHCGNVSKVREFRLRAKT